MCFGLGAWGSIWFRALGLIGFRRRALELNCLGSAYRVQCQVGSSGVASLPTCDPVRQPGIPSSLKRPCSGTPWKLRWQVYVVRR